MALTSPIGHGPLDVKVSWNESPPLYYLFEFRRDLSFTKQSGIFETNSRSFTVQNVNVKQKEYQILPEVGGLHGIALRPRQEHYHNFLYSYGNNSIVEDQTKVVNGLIGVKDSLLEYFGWRVVEGWYRETVDTVVPATASTPASTTSQIITPLINGVDDTSSASGTTSVPTELEERRQRGAKWSYKTYPCSIHSFAQTQSTLEIDDQKVSKLVPFQTQLQSSDNGPTGIGVHWALEKYVPLPYGLGFCIDFNINKDIDPVTSDAGLIKNNPTTGKPEYITVPFARPGFQNFFTSSIGSLQSSTGANTPDIDNNDIFNGTRVDGDRNSTFYFLNKSYIVIQIHGNSTTGNLFFIVISSDAHAKLFQVKVDATDANGIASKGSVKLLSEYNPNSGDSSSVPSGLRMLRGDNGHLNLQIRQIMNHIIIENNVFDAPWVINLKVYKPTPFTAGNTGATPGSQSVGSLVVNKIGGHVTVFGGNISCGVSYTHLNYYDDAEVTLDDTKVWGSGRTFYSRMSSSGAGQMNSVLVTNGKYFPNGAQMITDSDGTFDLSSRPDQSFGGFYGNMITPSQLIAEDTVTNVGSSTKLRTKIKLIAGEAGCRAFSGFNFGRCITPVLQFCRQIAPKNTSGITTSPIDINDLIETIEITKEAEDYHAVSVSGSMLINLLTPSKNEIARTAIIDSIGKARYLSINASHFGCAGVELQAHRVGGPHTGAVVPGEGGDRRLFTGIAFNPSITEEAGKRYIKFELKDFWTILESKLIINSPYFDGAIDTDVISYLMNYTGIKDLSGIHSGSRDMFPISFSFNEPLAKFKDKQPVAEAIKETAKKYTKYAFFNNNGLFCYQKISDILMLGTGGVGALPIKYRFYSSHIGNNVNIIPIGYFDYNYGPAVSHNSQIAYEVKTSQWNNKDIFNKILLMSVDARSRGMIIAADANFNLLTDPNEPGFLGYEKPFLQDEAAFADAGRVNMILRYYTRMFKPTYNITWKCIGGNLGVDVFDIVTIDNVLVVVNRISHTIDAKNNSWDTEYTGEWIFPPPSGGFNPTIT